MNNPIAHLQHIADVMLIFPHQQDAAATLSAACKSGNLSLALHAARQAETVATPTATRFLKAIRQQAAQAKVAA